MVSAMSLSLPLLAMAITGKDMLLLALAALAAIGLVGLAYRKDTEIEARRYNAIEIATFMSSIGLEHAAAFFNAYAVGDYSRMFKEAHSIVAIVKNPATRMAVLKRVALMFAKDIRDNPAEVIEFQKALGMVPDAPAPAATAAAKAA